MFQFILPPDDDDGAQIVLPPPTTPRDVDLSDIFVGRERQLDDFVARLERWRDFLKVGNLPPLPAPNALQLPATDRRLDGLFGLVHGRGGFGKSTLLRRWEEIARGYDQEFQVAHFDWENLGGEARKGLKPSAGETVDPQQYYELLSSLLATALAKYRSSLERYGFGNSFELW